MCGLLYSYLKTSQSDNFENIFSEALDLMDYRGPDAKAIDVVDNNYFGHVRLSIIDLKPSSNQPFKVNENTLVFNGEIYNYQDIEPESSSDTKTLFNLLSKKPSGYTKDLMGMYAFVYHDAINDELHIARDFFGEKPLYVFEDDNFLIVSSTIKSIAHILKSYSITLSLSKDAIDDLSLFGSIMEPDTIFNEIQCLDPRYEHTYTLNDCKWLRKERSIDNNYSIAEEKRYQSNAIEATDVKPTLLLSSGIDSSFIASIITEADLDADFCVYKSPNSTKDESTAALENIEKLNSKKDVLVVENEKNDLELYEKLINLLEQPTVHGIQIINILSKLKDKKKDLKVVLTGLGGDELYGGYNSFLHFKKYTVLKPFLKLFGFIPIENGYSRFFANKISDSNVLSYYYRYRANPAVFNSMSKSRVEKGYQRFKKSLPKMNNLSDISTLKLCESMGYMRNCLLRDSDNISMHFAIENRSPLLYYPALFSKEVGRKRFREHVEDSYNFTFKSKQGFTYEESKVNNAKHFHSTIDLLNKKYTLYDDNELALLRSDTNYTYTISAFVLLSWLEKNNFLLAKKNK